jgi:hypothetical protein
VRQRIVDRRFVALQSNKERNVRDITEGVCVADVFPAPHFFIQGAQVFFELLPRLVDFIVMGYVTACALEPGVAVVDPNSYPRTLKRVLGKKRYFGIFLFQVFIDDRGFVDNGVAVHQHRNFAVRVKFEKLLGFVAEIAFDEVVGNSFLCQDKPCPVSVGSGAVRKELHRIYLLLG